MDQKQFESFFKLYYPSLLLYIHKKIIDNDWVERIAIDCFVKLWNNRDEVKSVKAFKDVLFTYAEKQIITYQDKRKDEQILVDQRSTEVIIYINKEPGLHEKENIVNACGDFMEALGYEMETEDEPVYSSFWQRIKFIFKKNITEQDVNNLFDKGKKALELKYVELPTAEQTEKLASAAEKILSSVEKFDNCTIRLGSLLIVKRMNGTEPELKILHLSAKEIQYLEGNSFILRNNDPLTILASLNHDNNIYNKDFESLALKTWNEINASTNMQTLPPIEQQEAPKNEEPLSGGSGETGSKEGKIEHK